MAKTKRKPPINPSWRPDPNLIRPAGERQGQIHALVAERMGGALIDRPLADRPERRCSCCGKAFQPTQKRRLLCYGCFSRPPPDAA